MPRVERLLRGLAIVAVAASVALTAAFSFGLVAGRPVLSGEAEVLHEATRIHDGLPLYTDPIAGTFDAGPVPTRCYVAYTPLWSWALSHAPTSCRQTVARLLDALLWLGVLAWLASRARPQRRLAAWLAAGVVAGTYVTAIFASSARPDAAAAALVGVAVGRTARRGDLDAAGGALLAVAAWVKPNFLGAAAGLVLVALVTRSGGWRALLGVAGVSLPLAAATHVASHGLWIEHLVRTLGQPLELGAWWEHVGPRGMFVLPVAWTSWTAWRARAEPAGRLVLGAWVTSLGWALVSLAKVGASSNYWMEPAIVAVVVAGIAPVPAAASRRPALGWAFAAGAAAWLCAATTEGVVEAFVREPKRMALLGRARAECRSQPGEVVFSDGVAAQLALDGRLLDPGFQTLFLVLQDHLPVGVWIADMQRPEVSCMVEENGLFGVLPEVRAAVDARFVRVDSAEDWTLLALRDRVTAPGR